MDDHKTFHNKFGEQKTDEISIQNTNLLVNVLNDQFEKEKMQIFEEEKKSGLNFLEGFLSTSSLQMFGKYNK